MQTKLELKEEMIRSNGQRYFDSFSHQYNSKNIDLKLLDIALYLNEGGNLHFVISKYKRGRSIEHLSSLKDTLIYYITYLREHECITVQNEILSKYLSESQLITLLSEELKDRFAPDQMYIKDVNNPTLIINYGGYDLEDFINLPLSKEEITQHILLGNLFGKINLYNENKQTLLFENPWLDLAWEIEGNSFNLNALNVHSQDKDSILEFNSNIISKYQYHLEIPPEPFWGNVLDAKVVILTLNPGYVFEKNLIEYELLEDEMKEQFAKDKCDLMSLNAKQFIPESEISNSISDYYWENKIKYLTNNYTDVNSKIGLIQYLGYQSEKFNEFPKKITKGLEDNLLYTQTFSVRIIKYLMQENRVIIIARSKKYWFKAVEGLEDYPKLIILNSYQNTAISPNNCSRSCRFHLIEEALI